MIRAHFTDNETGWVEPGNDGTAKILNVPWTTDRFGYGDQVLLVPSTNCACKKCRIPQVSDVVERSNLFTYVLTLQRPKWKNLRRLKNALEELDPAICCAHLIGSWEIRVATCMDLGTISLCLWLKLPFRVNVLPFYPGKIG